MTNVDVTTDNPDLEDCLKKLRELFAAEFARGEQAAIQGFIGDINDMAPHEVLRAKYCR